jgi:hypothetical protein
MDALALAAALLDGACRDNAISPSHVHEMSAAYVIAKPRSAEDRARWGDAACDRWEAINRANPWLVTLWISVTSVQPGVA